MQKRFGHEVAVPALGPAKFPADYLLSSQANALTSQLV
jgi:hypothetical protein